VGIHQRGAAARQLPFAPVWKPGHQIFTGQKIQDGVTQEFQAFVILDFLGLAVSRVRSAAQLWNCRTVGQRGHQQPRIAKPVAQALLEFFVFGMRHQCLLEGASCFISAR
jgi:hypothetical protein